MSLFERKTLLGAEGEDAMREKESGVRRQAAEVEDRVVG